MERAVFRKMKPSPDQISLLRLEKKRPKPG
jgi:hypothetical protein